MKGRGARRLAACCLAAAAWGTAPAQQTTCRGALSMPGSGETNRFPQCVTADPWTGEVFVCDSRKNRVTIFDEVTTVRDDLSRRGRHRRFGGVGN